MTKKSFRAAAPVEVRYPALVEVGRSLRDWGLIAVGAFFLVACQRKAVEPEIRMPGAMDLTRLPDAGVDAGADATDASVEPARIPEDRVKGVKAINPHVKHPRARKK